MSRPDAFQSSLSQLLTPVVSPDLQRRAGVQLTRQATRAGASDLERLETLAMLGLITQEGFTRACNALAGLPVHPGHVEPATVPLCPGKRHPIRPGLIRKRSDGRRYCADCYSAQAKAKNARKRAARAAEREEGSA